jgi:hypothetical protein
MELIKESDVSFTSFGYPAQMSQFVRAAATAGKQAGPDQGARELVGIPIDPSRLRVIAPCVPRKRC